MKHKYYILIIAALIAGIVIRELFTSTYKQFEALKLQSERNRSAYAAKQFQESNARELQTIIERDQAHDLLVLYRKDLDRSLFNIGALKSKILQYEISDHSVLLNTDLQMDSIFFARYPQQDSLYRLSSAAGRIRP